MQKYNDPNASMDAPVKREIIIVLLGFSVMVAMVAVVINVVMG